MKQRFKKKYRHPTLDEKLTAKRTSQEVRSLLRCQKAGQCVEWGIYFTIREPMIYSSTRLAINTSTTISVSSGYRLPTISVSSGYRLP